MGSQFINNPAGSPRADTRVVARLRCRLASTARSRHTPRTNVRTQGSSKRLDKGRGLVVRHSGLLKWVSSDHDARPRGGSVVGVQLVEVAGPGKGRGPAGPYVSALSFLNFGGREHLRNEWIYGAPVLTVKGGGMSRLGRRTRRFVTALRLQSVANVGALSSRAGGVQRLTNVNSWGQPDEVGADCQRKCRRGRCNSVWMTSWAGFQEGQRAIVGAGAEARRIVAGLCAGRGHELMEARICRTGQDPSLSPATTRPDSYAAITT